MWEKEEEGEIEGIGWNFFFKKKGRYMNDKHFMGLRIRFEGGGQMNGARQSTRGAPDSMAEDA